jgi:hypothetical protein
MSEPGKNGNGGPPPALLARRRQELEQRVARQFKGVEYVDTVTHDDGSATVTFLTFDNNVNEVLEALVDLIEEIAPEGIRVLVMPHE